jgi:hypothetical protein
MTDAGAGHDGRKRSENYLSCVAWQLNLIGF